MRNIYLFAAAALAMASCSSDDFVGGVVTNERPASDAIMFSPTSGRTTRADHVGADAATMLNNNFVVEGVSTKDGVQTEQFDHYNVLYTEGTANTTESNTTNWEYVGIGKHGLSAASEQTIKYWDFSSSQYDFVAFSYGKSDYTKAVLTEIKTANLGKAVDATNHDNAVYTITGNADELAKTYIADLVTMYNRNGVSEYKTTITPKFRSLGTKVRVAFYETVPGYSVKNVKFYAGQWNGTVTSASGSEEATLFANNVVFPSETTKGTMSVYYPTVGWEKSGKNGSDINPDYNQAHVKFEAGSESGEALVKTKTFGTLDYKTGKEGSEEDATQYLGRESSTATYAGDASANYYQIVLPLGTSDNLQIRVEYDLVPIDGGAGIIHVRDARAVVPAAYADWKPNYAYTYIFKISDNTNGWTGTDGDGNVVEGLTPITFDAVVTETEDGIQETITGVATPSITTYQEGVNATAISEYKPGVIYAAVMNGTENVTLATTNMAVYKASTDGTNAITEAIVQDMLDGKKHDTGITLTPVGYEIVSSVPAVDGNTLSVKAAKFTAQAGCTYVFMYTDGSKNYCKVIKIASEGVAGIAYNWQAAVNSYTYTATVTATGGNEITFTYATADYTGANVVADLARYLGAIYYAGGASAIVWNDGTNNNSYAWDPAHAGYLMGSNWWNSSTSKTLVKEITTWYASNSSETQIVLTIDGTATTLKLVVNS